MLNSHTTHNLRTSDNLYFNRAIYYGKPVILPILLASIPTLYHYSNNVENLTLLNLSRMLVFNIILAVIAYLIFMAFTKFQPARAANAAFVFLIFFNIYGLLYRYLVKVDVIRIEHYTLLPLILLLAFYLSLLLTKLKDPLPVNLWNSLVLIAGVLTVFNLVQIVPSEVRRWNRNINAASLDAEAQLVPARASPDIYYIILDEFAGFQAMRDYWKYEGVNDFAGFLKEKGFFVAEASHGSSSDTLHEMASRLNYQEYPSGDEGKYNYFNDIADNRVVRYLKSRGYTIVVFDEMSMGYPAAKPMNADYLYEYGTSSIPQTETRGYGLYLDEFGELVIDNTMLYAISDMYTRNSPLIKDHSSMIYFTVEHIADKKISSPKFVHVHLLLPHLPFMFNQNGEINENAKFGDWNYYFNNYIFSISIAEKMITNILSAYDPENPPIIILQSDHGARNHAGRDGENVTLPNYPEKYKTLILNALLIPGFDSSGLHQDIDPINTFPILFNYLFDANIPLTE